MKPALVKAAELELDKLGEGESIVPALLKIVSHINNLIYTAIDRTSHTVSSMVERMDKKDNMHAKEYHGLDDRIDTLSGMLVDLDILYQDLDVRLKTAQLNFRNQHGALRDRVDSISDSIPSPTETEQDFRKETLHPGGAIIIQNRGMYEQELTITGENLNDADIMSFEGEDE